MAERTIHHGPEPAPAGTPPGWTSNPSSWRQRLPIVVLALIGAAIASYLGAYQLGIVHSVWEPFFGNGTLTVLE